MLWDMASGKERANLQAHATSLRFTPDGQTLALATAAPNRPDLSEIKLWDVATGQQRATLKGHGDGVTSLAFTPDGKTLISGSFDKTVKLWHAFQMGSP